MANRWTQSEVLEAAQQAAETLGPEAGLFTDADPVSLGRTLAQAVAGAVRHPLDAFTAGARFASGLAMAGGASLARALGVDADGPVSPASGDRRFADPAWDGNPVFYGGLQGYLLWSRLVEELLGAARLEGMQGQKAELAAQMIVDALAPTNMLWSNPAALKKAFDTGGASVARGVATFVDDLLHNEGRPRQVDPSAFTVGQDLAATPGKVVFRNELMELIQYAPQTETVHEIPLLASPPWINKYYIMDLAPGRSFYEWAVQHGHTVFAISYRNPDATMGEVSMDDYLIHGPRTALDVIRDITGAEQVNIAALCLGGTLSVALLAYLEATGEGDRVRSTTLLNTLIDFSQPGPMGAFTDLESIERLERKMARRGYLEGSEMRTTFDILRANDLIWNYVVSNWLMGEDPPAFDILAWNADSTRMPAKMHSFYLRSCYLRNELAQGQMELAGQRLHLDSITSDVYMVAAQRDHIAPWRASYQTTQLLPKADVRFVLSSSGHIAGIVNPPSPKARHWTNAENPPDPVAWFEDAELHQASWWEHWTEWVAERAGDRVEPPPVGGPGYPPLGDAPGTYVHG